MLVSSDAGKDVSEPKLELAAMGQIAQQNHEQLAGGIFRLS
jgi:hypothetical protein